MYRVELLPAANGDAVWIEYGSAKRPRRIVIDGGPAPSYEQGLRERILKLGAADRRIDLFVVSHIDCDHIDGAIILLREAREVGVEFGEIWFNGWNQIEGFGPPLFQAIHGEFLGQLLEKPGSDGTRIRAAAETLRDRWNSRVSGRAIVVPDDGPLPAWDLPDGARLTLLSPGIRQLNRLRARWQSAVRDLSPADADEALRRLAARRQYEPPALPPVFSGRAPGNDRSVANGSSIAFVLEHGGASSLFASDAHPRVLTAALRRFARERNPLGSGAVAFDAIKVPHHGSIGNINEELVKAVESPRWLISTNGAVSGHPDRETAHLVAKYANEPPVFICNYKDASTMAFAAKPGERWQTKYPGEGVERGPTGGIVVDLTRRTAPARRRKARSRPARARRR